MRYHVMVVPRDEAYINNLPLSTLAKRLITKFISGAVGGVSDEFREHNRPKPGSPYFQMRLAFRDWWGDKQPHTVDFVVNDARVAMGVLEIVWVDYQ